MIITQATTTARCIATTLDCRAPRPKVFQTWTEPEWLKRWFRAGEGFACTAAEVDLRPGGRFTLAMARPGEAETRFTGVYQLVRAPDALVYTWGGGEGEHETLVTALFTDRGTGSRVEFTHGVFATAEAQRAHAEGWLACFRMFELALEA